MMKTIIIALLALTLTNCASTNYKVKQEAKEEGRVLNQVPQWYIDAKIDKGFVFNRNADLFVYAVGQGSSPDLQLAIEKAMMIAKAELADKVKGEMNKKAKIFTTELGKNTNKTVVTDVETTLVNIIKQTPVRGYEVFAQEVTLTKNGYYRSWIGLRLPMGEYNKMYNYSIETVVDAFKLKEMADKAYDEVEVIANES